MYDGTRFREIPAISLLTQNGHAHEIPVYGEIFKDANGKALLGWAMHGPQEPLEIGVEAPTPLPDKGVNPFTDADRLQFDRARPVPYVHSILIEWYDPRHNTCWHFEGGIRVHQVAAKKVWYVKTGYGDNGEVSSDPVHDFAITGKIIFQQRWILDADGSPGVVGSATNWQKVGGTSQIAGGPSTITLDHRGTKHYPKFTTLSGTAADKLTIRISEAKFNPLRIASFQPFINRQGMVVKTDEFHAFSHTLSAEVCDDRHLDPSWNDWRMGDELTHADVPATILH
jgi:hypothetical protein